MFQIILPLIALADIALADQKLVCYWLHGNDPGSTIDPNICTHIHYSFVSLDYHSLKIIHKENITEPGNHNDLMAIKAKHPGLKVVVALSGAADIGSEHYGRLVTSAENRALFVESSLQFLNQNNFDGLDLDWEYPACPLMVCDDKHQPEKPGFASLLRELRVAFDKNSRNLSLSVAVFAGKSLSDKAYDYQTMASAVDYINVMTYDNDWKYKAIHHSGFEWCKKSMNTWAANGVPKNKLILGVPFYGIAFTLQNTAHHELDAPVVGRADAIKYWQICQKVKIGGWKKERSVDGPIAYLGVNWVGYDDPISIAEKAKWSRDNGFGGVLIWEVSQDDINAQCCLIDKPMLKAVNYGLFGKGSDPRSYGCE